MTDSISEIISDFSGLSHQDALGLFRQIAKERGKEFCTAAVVALANERGVGALGERLVDSITPSDIPGRRQYDVHPFSNIGAAGMGIVAYRDTAGEIYIAFGDKPKRDYLPPELMQEYLYLPGGYVNAPPPGVDATEMPGFDKSIPDILYRKMKEELGLDLVRPLQFVGEPMSTYGLSEVPAKLTAQHYMLGDLGVSETPPVVGSSKEFLNARWVKASNLICDGWQEDHGVNVPLARAEGETSALVPVHALYINQALRVMRDQELEQKIGMNRSALEHFCTDALPTPPASEFGKEASAYHQTLLEAGKQLRGKIQGADTHLPLEAAEAARVNQQESRG